MKAVLILAILLAIFSASKALRVDQHHQATQQQQLTLSFDVAARDQASRGLEFPLSVSWLGIIWNNVLVGYYRAKDYEIHHLSFKLSTKEGINTLSFSLSNEVFSGSCFNNVSLKNQDGEELIRNRQLETNIGQYGHETFSQTVPLKGWKTRSTFMVGLPNVFNKRFTSRVIALDNQHTSVYQEFLF